MTVSHNGESFDLPVHLLQDRQQRALLFTTNPGIEDVVVEEFQERSQTIEGEVTEGKPRPYELAGYAQVESTASRMTLLEMGRQMRSIHHLLEPYYTFMLPRERMLDVLCEVVEDLALPDLEDASSFRVSTVRSGTHDFTSMDVQRVAGAAVQAHYGTPVDLEGYAVEVRVDLFDQRCLVSLQHTREALSRRHQRAYESPAALKPNVAYGLLRLAWMDPPPTALLDPFCGSGTILLEAASYWPEAKLYGSDWNEKAAAGARRNATVEGLNDRITIQCADARDLTEAFADLRVQAIVTNPPYGVRVGQGMNFFNFYRQFLDQAAVVLESGGHLVLLVLKRGAFNRAVQQSDSFFIRHVRVIETSGIYPYLFVLERT